jgi:mono/diheme cytochrome c family protein
MLRRVKLHPGRPIATGGNLMHWFKILFGFLVAALAIAACNPEPGVGASAGSESQAAATTAAPAPPPAEVDTAAYRGAAIAGQVCAQCHDIGLGQAAGVDIGAPTFRSIAKRPESTPAGLEAWMRASHPRMPNYMFEGPDVADLAAFIVSLRDAPG